MSTKEFRAGRLKEHVENWRKITSDDNILDIVQHCHIEFMQDEDPSNSYCFRSRFSEKENKIISKEIEKLLQMEVIEEVEHHPDEYISPIFIIPKRDGEYRMILNLKDLNRHVEYHHFKMDTFESVLKLVKPNMYFASTDIRHGYYSVPIIEKDRKKLRFKHLDKLYQYRTLPNGISCAPRQFTKLMKPVYASLRMLGHKNSGYIDDSLLMGDTYLECEVNVHDTVYLMSNLGFLIHEKKSVLIPTKKIIFLGNWIDSEKMIVTLPVDKVEKITQACKELCNQDNAKIRDVARVLGLLVSSFSAVEFGPLFYRTTERAKIQALQHQAGDYDAFMIITPAMKQELSWWIKNLHNQQRNICHGNPDVIITTDASAFGWGAICGNVKIGGRWDDQEIQNHINFLELLAAYYALKSFCKTKTSIHVQILSDNSCTVAHIRNMGGKTDKLNALAKETWLWCKDRAIWLSAAHIPGILNEADFCSRNFINERVEWKLNEDIFTEIVSIFGMPEVDMFASRLNKQIECFVSWKPDPEAVAVDAFSVSWRGKYIYAFPPFSLMGRLLQKARQDQADVLLVAPFWVTQNFYTTILEMLTHDPLIIKVGQNTLKFHSTQKIHPLVNKLHLMLCRISGNPLKVENYQKNLSISSWNPGEIQQRSNMPRILTDGFRSVVKGKLIHFKPLSSTL